MGLYELFANCESDVSLVLCNKRSEVRVMKTYKDVPEDFNLPQMQHPNILGIYEAYIFKDQMFIALTFPTINDVNFTGAHENQQARPNRPDKKSRFQCKVINH